MFKKFISILTLLTVFSCAAQPAVARGYYSRGYRAPVVIHHYHNDGGGAATGFIAGALIGHALSQPTQPVVVQPVQPVQVAPVVQPQIVEQPVIVHSEEHNGSMMTYLLALLTVIGLGGFILVLHKQNKDKHNA